MNRTRCSLAGCTGTQDCPDGSSLLGDRCTVADAGPADSSPAEAGASDAEGGALDQARTTVQSRAISECSNVDCADELATVLGVDFVALVTVWSGNSGEPSMVVVTLVPPDGNSQADQSDVHDSSELEARAAEAARGAYDRLQTSRLGSLSINTEPPGALVQIDADITCQSSCTRRVAPGIHQVQIALDGYVTERQEVSIGVGQNRSLSVTLRLESVDVDGGGNSDAQLAGLILSIAGGAAFGLGATMMIAGAAQASEDRYQLDEGIFATWSVVTGAGIALGIVGLVLLLLDGESESTGQTALGPWVPNLGRL